MVSLMNVCRNYNFTVLSQTLRMNFFLRCKGRWIACFVLIQPSMSGTQLFYPLFTKTDTLQLSMSKYQEAFKYNTRPFLLFSWHAFRIPIVLRYQLLVLALIEADILNETFVIESMGRELDKPYFSVSEKDKIIQWHVKF